MSTNGGRSAPRHSGGTSSAARARRSGARSPASGQAGNLVQRASPDGIPPILSRSAR